MNILDLVSSLGHVPKRTASTHGGQWNSPCPACGGDDRFCIWPNQEAKNCTGTYWCRSCGKGGDAIQFCVDFLKMTYSDAFRHLGIATANFSAVTPAKDCYDLIFPDSKWLYRAKELVTWASGNVFKYPEIMSLLERRGILFDSIVVNCVGYCDRDLMDKKEKWGIEVKDEKNKLYIPRGIVIPTLDDGDVIRIKIRTFNDERKYYKIPGSANGYSIFGQMQSNVMIVLESELDALLLSSIASEKITVVSAGTNLCRPDYCTDELARRTPNLWICHDNDEAGLAMLSMWQKMYSHAVPMPVPVGKDPGEAFQAGFDLKSWLLNKIK